MTGGQIVGSDTVQCWSAMHHPAKIFMKKSVVGHITLLGLRRAAMKGVATLLLHLALHRNLPSIWDQTPAAQGRTQRVVGGPSKLFWPSYD